MKRGEVAILTCKPDYAYGVSGSPPKIPSNSTLEFEVGSGTTCVETMARSAAIARLEGSTVLGPLPEPWYRLSKTSHTLFIRYDISTLSIGSI